MMSIPKFAILFKKRDHYGLEPRTTDVLDASVYNSLEEAEKVAKREIGTRISYTGYKTETLSATVFPLRDGKTFTPSVTVSFDFSGGSDANLS